MPYQTFLVRKARHFVPSEASASAAELKSIAREARGLATRLREITSQLDSSWEGRSSARFLDAFQGQAPAAESSADWFQAKGQSVGSITVTIWDTESQTVWVPDS
jgi:uncharacterized protein YukE